jgi:rhodanese-related sulfurtransferase
MNMKDQISVFWMRLFGFCALLAVWGCVLASAGTTPTSLEGATVVDAAKAKSLMEAGAVMIDARVANEYVELHIRGSKNIPYKEKSSKTVDYDSTLDSFALSQLSADKNMPTIFACNGPECWKSYKAARAAVKAGYKHIYWLRGGLPEWQANGYPVE